METSNKPPIYGVEANYGFQILDPGTGNSMPCNNFRRTELYDILKTLNYPAPEIDEKNVIDYLEYAETRFLEDIDPKELEDLKYNTRWELAGFNHDELCTIIKEELKKINHIL